MLLLAQIASLVGCSEPALRLLISVLVAFPIVIIYRLFLHNNSNITPRRAHAIFIVSGFMICLFNYGWDVYHTFVSVLFTYIINNLLYKSKLLVPVAFIFHMSYLLVGYYKTATEHYDICWTMCHCVMVLRLIGLSVDVSDSIKKPEVLAISDSRPYKIPSIREVFGFAYFPPTVIIGPQVSFKRYMEFVDHKYDVGQHNFRYGLKRFVVGAFYLAVYQLLALFVVPESLFLSQEFGDRNLFYKIFMVSIWGRASLYKYISCWIMSEGATTCSGLTFVSRDEKTGEEDWSGCTNIRIKTFENTNSFGDYVASFNVQTNLWVFNYVYKRLRFLNNKNISHISALLFLAVWHGFHDGYYMTFFMEFLLIHFEKEVTPLFKNNPKFQKFLHSAIWPQVVVFLILKSYTFFIAGYCLIPFVYLSFHKWWAIYKKFYFLGHIIVVPMSFLWKPLVVKFLKIYFPLDKKEVSNNTAQVEGGAIPNNSKHQKEN